MMDECASYSNNIICANDFPFVIFLTNQRSGYLLFSWMIKLSYLPRKVIMHIELMDRVNAVVVEAFERLMPQLTRHSPPPTHDELLEIVASKATFVFLAWLPDRDGDIIGAASLGTFRTPTGVHGWIEDVVVDRDARRLGIGKALTQACLDKARDLGLREVNLTSRSSRCVANQLYQAMGFVRRETNLYRYPLE